jgi:phage terminase small subunit
MLSAKQQRFCEEYVIDLNGTQAAIRSGYSEKTANRIASQLLSKLDIQRLIQSKQKSIAGKLQITQERVLLEYARLGFSDVRKLFDASGTGLKNITELDDDTAAAISSLDVEEIRLDGTPIGVVKKLKTHSKTTALDSLAKHLGLFKEDNSQKGSLTMEQIDRLTDEEKLQLLALKQKMSGI